MSEKSKDPTHTTIFNNQVGHPERIVPDETTSGIVAIHLKRYNFARGFVRYKRVLDVACGVGYGTAFLAESAAEVTGVDIDAEAIRYAQKRYGSAHNVQFFCEDAGQLHFGDDSFDVVCSFETIEHIPDVERFLSEVVRVLKPDGTLFVSTPAAKTTTQTPSNPHHVQEWSPRDFETLLSSYFAHVQLFSQMPRTTPSASLVRRLDRFSLRALVPLWIRRVIAGSIGVRTTGDLSLDDVLIVEGPHRDAREIVAICK